jgi:hypothetical protein
MLPRWRDWAARIAGVTRSARSVVVAGSAVATGNGVAHRQQLLERRGAESDLAVVLRDRVVAGSEALQRRATRRAGVAAMALVAWRVQEAWVRAVVLTDDVAARLETPTQSAPTAGCRWLGCPPTSSLSERYHRGQEPPDAPLLSGFLTRAWGSSTADGGRTVPSSLQEAERRARQW